MAAEAATNLPRADEIALDGRVLAFTLGVSAGAALGALTAVLMSFAWLRYSYLINLKLFFQGTAIFLFLFSMQVLMYAFHEYTEAGIFPNSEYWHVLTESYSHDGIYGKWFSTGMVLFFPAWLIAAWFQDKFFKKAAVTASAK